MLDMVQEVVEMPLHHVLDLDRWRRLPAVCRIAPEVEKVVGTSIGQFPEYPKLVL